MWKMILYILWKESFYEYRKKSLPSNLPWVDICAFKWKINNIVYHKKVRKITWHAIKISDRIANNGEESQQNFVLSKHWV